MKKSIMFFILAMIPTYASAGEQSVKAAFAAGEAKCFSFRRGWLVDTTGPCAGYKPPHAVALGETFEVGGEKHTIGIISAHTADHDFQYQDFVRKRGDIACVAAESQGDLGENSSTRNWIYIFPCAFVPLDDLQP